MTTAIDSLRSELLGLDLDDRKLTPAQCALRCLILVGPCERTYSGLPARRAAQCEAMQQHLFDWCTRWKITKNEKELRSVSRSLVRLDAFLSDHATGSINALNRDAPRG